MRVGRSVTTRDTSNGIVESTSTSKSVVFFSPLLTLHPSTHLRSASTQETKAKGEASASSPSEEKVKPKKRGNTILHLAGNVVSLGVAIAYLGHAFDQQIENMKIAIIALVLGFLCMKLTDYLF
jgi:hypothetical protein